MRQPDTHISLLSAVAAILSSIAAIVSTPFFTNLVPYGYTSPIKNKNFGCGRSPL
jgi:hypothetical protein